MSKEIPWIQEKKKKRQKKKNITNLELLAAFLALKNFAKDHNLWQYFTELTS